MIVFTGQPNRCHPIICNEIERCYRNSVTEEYHRTWRPAVHNWEKQKWMQANRSRWFPSKCDVVYGAFPSRMIPRDCEFSFTFISHPVDRIYQCWAYADIQLQESKDKLNYEMFSSLDISTAHEFIDKILLYGKTANFFVAQEKDTNIEYTCEYESIFQCKTLQVFDYVGIVEQMEKSIDILNKKLNIDIKYDPKMLPFTLQYDQYRRSELEVLLKEDVQQYEQYIHRLGQY